MGVNHPHPDQPGTQPSRRAFRLAVAVLVPAAIMTVVGLIWLWPTGSIDTTAQGEGPPIVTGSVTSVHSQPCPPPPAPDPGTEPGTAPGTDPGSEPDPGSIPGAEEQAPPDGDEPGVNPGKLDCGTVTVKLTSGPDRGQRITTDIPNGPGAVSVRAGDDITLMYLPDSLSGRPYQIQDHQRGTQLWLLAAAFVLAVVAFGRVRGVTALAGLAVTFTVLLLFIVPAILDGSSPLMVAIVGSAAIMLTVLYLTHGVTVPVSMALVGTLASLVLTGVFAAAATAATRLSGLASEETTYLQAIYGNVNMRGLLLAGIVIGCLGVLDDVTITQSAIVTELSHANPTYTVRQLYRAATRVGRSHIASVVNTIILAYAGASLPLLVLLAAGGQPLGQTLTSQFIAEEIVRGVVGTIGLIAAVPVTTMLAALAARGGRTTGATPEPTGAGKANPRPPDEPAVARLAREDDNLW